MSGILDPRILPFRNSGCNSSSISALSNSSVCLCVHYLSFQWILVGLRVLHGSKCTLLMAFFLSLSLGLLFSQKGLSAGVNGGPSGGSSMHGPGSEDPYCKKKKIFVLCIVFFDFYFTNYVSVDSFLHMKTYLVCIAINPSYFINIILSILYLNWII